MWAAREYCMGYGYSSDAGMSFLLSRPSRKWIENEHAIAFADAFPVTDGHTLVIPRRHVSSIYELSAEEQSAVWDLVAEVRHVLLDRPQAGRIQHRRER